MDELIVTLKRAGWNALKGALESVPIITLMSHDDIGIEVLDTGYESFKAAAVIVSVRALAAGYPPIAAYVSRKAANGHNGIHYGH